MVKFGVKLRSKIKQEWVEYYVDYERLKDILYEQVALESHGRSGVRNFFTSPSFSSSPRAIGAPSGSSSSTKRLSASSCSPRFSKWGAAASLDENSNAGGEDRKELRSPLLGASPGGCSEDGEVRMVDITELAVNESAEENFAAALEDEIRKVNDFYVLRVREYEARLRLQRQLLEKDHQRLTVRGTATRVEYGSPIDDKKAQRRAQSVKYSMKTLHRFILSLQGFASLNYTAAMKIIKKHDKLFPESAMKTTAFAWIGEQAFCADNTLAALRSELEALFAEAFCDEDEQVARTMITLVSGENTGSDMFHFGWRVGIGMMLFVWFIWDAVMDESHGFNLWNDPAIHIYKGMGAFVLLYWMWALNVYVWTRNGVSYIDIFRFDRRRTMRTLDILEQAATLTIFFAANLIVYYKVRRHQAGFMNGVAAGLCPLLLVIFMLANIVCPFSRRKVLFITICNTISAPFGPVGFKENFMGDVFTSLVRVFADLASSLCFYFSGDFRTDWSKYYDDNDDAPKLYMSSATNGTLHDDSPSCSDGSLTIVVFVPLLSAMPLAWRFLQCIRRYHDTDNKFPHLLNAGKYACALSVVLFGVFHPDFSKTGDGLATSTYQMIWIVAFCIATMYQFIWDVTQDWSLFVFAPARRGSRFHSDGDGGSGGGFLTRWLPSDKRVTTRHRLMYGKLWIYFTAAALNFFLRCLWTLSLIPERSGSPFLSNIQEYLSPFLATAEILRRTMWGMFRLENEHLKLCREESDWAELSDRHGVDFVPLTVSDKDEQEAEHYEKGRIRKNLVESVVIVTVMGCVALGAALSAGHDSSDD